MCSIAVVLFLICNWALKSLLFSEKSKERKKNGACCNGKENKMHSVTQRHQSDEGKKRTIRSDAHTALVRVSIKSLCNHLIWFYWLIIYLTLTFFLCAILSFLIAGWLCSVGWILASWLHRYANRPICLYLNMSFCFSLSFSPCKQFLILEITTKHDSADWNWYCLSPLSLLSENRCRLD